ncbi:hypothetical protein F2Q70_00038178 [Brassica cretica]|uniref:Uncharacterized protein n=1 Tax=Brassica cretica TaxID=69181 RepID=A0A8S9K3K2_BRACR|nr:hypothetical protein F2Q70_00038178 [Brassica cretica]
MPLRGRLSREEKGKGVADSPNPTRDARVADSPPDDFDLIHRDALRDLDNMTLSQRLLVAEAHKMIRDECADRVEVGSSDVSGSGSEASSQASRSLRRASREIPFDQIDYRPTIYHPDGIFEELGPLPSELLRDPRAQSWGNVACASVEFISEVANWPFVVVSVACRDTSRLPCIQHRPEISVLGTAIIFGLELLFQDVSQISEYRRIVVIVVGRQKLLREYNLDASAISRMLFVG